MVNSSTNINQMTCNSNNTQVEVDKKEAGGVKVVVETSKDSKVIGEHVITVVSLQADFFQQRNDMRSGRLQ